MKGQDVRGSQREAPDLSWAGPAEHRMRELLADVPRGCSVVFKQDPDRLDITFQSHSSGCISAAFAGVVTVGWVLAIWIALSSGLLLPFCFGVALVVVAGLWRLCGLARQVVTLDHEAAALELRDWPTYSRLVPRNAVRQVRAWPQRRFFGIRSWPEGLVLRADKDYLVTCAIPRKSILWLGRLLSAWSGAEFVQHVPKE